MLLVLPESYRLRREVSSSVNHVVNDDEGCSAPV
jgi:hypothetical protein